MSDDYSANAQTTGTVAVGGSTTGTIETAYDEDWFAVELVGGRTYQFDLQGSPGGGGTLPDTYLRAIYNRDGRYQSGTYNDNFDGSRDSRVTFTPTDSGRYYVRVSGDRDEIGSYTLSVRDVTPPEAVNPPPAFDQQGYAFDLAENADGSANGISLGTVSATDADGGSVSYGIEGGNESGRFEIDAASGELFYTGGGEDYETGATRFELIVRASHGDETTDTSVTVNVTDVDEPVEDNRPVVQSDQSVPQTVSEPDGEDFSADPSTSGRVAVGDTATGTIGTAREKDWFAVELVAGRTYVIDLRGSPTNDGTLSDPYLRGIYDAEGNRIANTTNDDGGQGYNSRVTFTATESGTHYIAAGAYSSRQGTYEVEVTDTSPPMVGPDVDSGDPLDSQEQVQQQPPAFGSQFYGFELEENADGSANRLSLGAVSATDPDGGSVSYGIEGGNESGRFEIDAASGELFYVGAGEDYETGTTSFNLTVRASDGAQTTDATVAVNVTDVAEAPAFGQAGYAFDLAENADGSANRLSLGAVSATDPDGGSVSYSIAGGNAAGLFELDAASGELFYTGGGEDYDTGTTSFNLTVRASDGDQTTDTAVTVNVTDVAEAPAFAQAGYAFDLAENADGSANRISLGTVSATDPDGGSVSYGIEGGNEAGRFEIDAASGELFYVGGGEDYETGATRFELTVRASDGDQTTDATVTVDVTDVDEPVVVDPPVAQEVQSVPQTVSEGATDLPNDNSTPGRVAVGGSVTGTIGAGRDQDRFAVELVAGRTYQFDLEGSPGGGGTLPDTYFRAIYNSEGRYQSGTYNDDFEGSRDSRVTFTPEESGTYYARVSGDRNETGTYTLTVTDMTPPEAGESSTDPVIPEPQEPTLEFVGPDQDAQQESTSEPDAQGQGVPPVPETSQAQGEQENVSEPDGQDLPADTTTTGRIAPGGSVTGTIDTIVKVHHQGASETDWFAAELIAGTLYRIDLKGSTTGHGTLNDPYLYGIFDSDGNRIPNTANDDSRAPSRNSRVEFTPEEDGTYFIAAGAYAGHANNTGTYTLTMSTPDDDYSAGMDTEGSVPVGGSAAGEIETTEDQDWFAATLEAGTTYRVVIEGNADHENPLHEPNLVGIYDPNGAEIPATTIRSSSLSIWSTYVEITPETAGTHYIAVDGQLSFGKYTGGYTVSVKAPNDDYSAGTDTEGTVVVGGTATGEIEVIGDEDWFAVDVVAGTHYRVELITQNGYGTVIDPNLAGVYYESGGNLLRVTAEPNRGIGNHAPLTFEATETGTYYIAAADAHSRGVGTYTLAVTEILDDYAADTATTGTVAVGGMVEGDIETPRDEDWFAVELEAGTTYRVDLKRSPTGADTLRDPYLRGIYDADGERIANTTDDDGGAIYNSRVYFTPDEEATYYVAAGAYRNDAGTYTLSVEEVVDGM